jgi:hypothetical protein
LPEQPELDSQRHKAQADALLSHLGGFCFYCRQIRRGDFSLVVVAAQYTHRPAITALETNLSISA